MQLNFEKYQGAGNDFVILGPEAEGLSAAQIATICHRRFGIGADGLIILLPSNECDFEMVYYNADGNLGSLCGNGARCAVACFLSKNNIGKDVAFMAADGPHSATQDTNNPEIIRLMMAPVSDIQKTDDGYYLNTGSPHLVCFGGSLADINVEAEGSRLRHHPDYTAYNGVNVNFVEVLSGNCFGIRTYERGVEAETLACGTGITAAALVLHFSQKCNSHSLRAQAYGGKLEVSFEPNLGGGYSNICLSGPAKKVFDGQIDV